MKNNYTHEKRNSFLKFILGCIFFLSSFSGFAATWFSNDATLNTNANVLAKWSGDRFGGSGNPANLTSADTFVIQSGHQYQLSNTWAGNAAGIIQVESGGGFNINGFGITALLRLDISGTGVGGNGALLNTGGARAISSPITLTNAATIKSSGTGTLTLSGTLTNGGNTLTIDGAQATTMTGNNTDTGGLTKNGAGTLTLNTGTITYSGTTTVNAGILAPGAANKLSPNSALVVVSGGTVNIATFAQTVLSISDGGGAGGIITGTSGNLTFGDATNTTYSGTITTTTGGITKNGAGITTMSGANTFTGTTNINAGTIKYGANNVLNTGAVTVSGGTLDLATFTDSVGTVQLTTGGSINSTTGVLTSTATYDLQNGTVSAILAGGVGLTKTTAGTVTLSGVNTYTGVTTINAGTLSVGTIGNGSVAGNLGAATNAAANLVLGNGTLQYTGATASTDRNFTITAGTIASIDVTTGGTDLTISGASTVTTGALTKIGAGKLILSGANGYTGTTTVSAGTLQYGINNALSSGAVIVNDGGTYNLNGFSDTIGALTVNSGVTGGTVTTGAGTLTLGGNITSTGGATNASISGNLSVGAVTRTITTTNAADGLTISAIVSSVGAFGITKLGTGILTMSGLNTYTGITTITAGTLSVANIGDGGVAGNLGAATNAAANLVLDGGTLQYTGASGSTNRNYTLIAAKTSTIDVTTNTLTISGASAVTTGLLTKTGNGTLVLSGANGHTGLTTVSAGTLQYGINNALSSGAVTVNNGGTYDLNGFSDTIGALNVNSGVTGGAVTTGAGTLTLGGDITSTGGATNASISGNLSVGAVTRTITTTNAADGLSISAVISSVGAFGIIKAGSGTLTLSGTNTYTGTTTINLGSIIAGASTTILGSCSAVTITNAAATLNLNNFDVAIGSLAGAGPSGAVTLGSGTLTTGCNGTNTTFAGVISGSGGLTKTGAGTFTLGGAGGNNTYSGNTLISQGIIKLGRVTGVLGDTTGTTTISSGAAIDVNGQVYTSVEPTTINGNGGGNGAITNTTGVGSYAGNITLGSAAEIESNTGGTSLAITGTINNAGFDLTIDGTKPSTFSGVISGSGKLIKNGAAGVATMSALNTYTGNTDVNVGTLKAGIATSGVNGPFGNCSKVTLGNVASTLIDITGFDVTIGSLNGGGATGGTVTLGSNTLTFGCHASNATYDGVISGTGNIIKVNTTEQTFTRANTFSGNATINSGILKVGVLNAISAVALTVNSPGKLDMNGFSVTVDSIAGDGTIDNVLGGGSSILTFGDGNNTNFTGIIQNSSGTVGITKVGAGTTTLSGNNTFTGPINVNLGKLQAGSTTCFGNCPDVTIANAVATLDITGFDISIDSLTGAGAGGTITLGSQTLTLGCNDGTGTTYAGLIQGAGNIVKAGTGTQTLSKANTYTGTTTINAGTLKAGIATDASSNSPFGNCSDVTINGTGTLDINGTAQKIGSLTGAATSITTNTGAAAVLTVGCSNFTKTYPGTIQGAIALTTASGTGKFTLTGNNTYSGATIVSTGILNIQSATALGSTAAGTTVSSGASLELENAAGMSIAAGEGLTLNNTGGGNGALRNILGNNTWNGTIAISTNATRINSDAGLLTLSGAMTGALGVTFGGVGNITSTGQIQMTTASGTVSKDGAGTLTLSNTSNNYAGATAVTTGILKLGAAGVIPDLSALTLTSPASLDMNGFSETVGSITGSGNISSSAIGTIVFACGGDNSSPAAYTGIISNGSATSIGFTKNGSGTITLSGNNTYTGPTTINSTGTLKAGFATNAFGICSAVSLTSTGTLDLAGFSQTIGSLASATGSFVDNTVAGNYTLTTGCNNTNTSFSGIIRNTSGTLNLLKNGNGIFTISGTNSYSGNTDISSGTIRLGSGTCIPNASPVTITGTLDMGGFSETVGSIAGAGNITSTVAGNLTLTSGGDNSSTTFSGLCSNGTATSIGLTKTGNGELTLTNTNTYTGITTITAGKIAVSSNANLGSNAAISMGGGTLHATATFTLTKTVTLTATSSIEVDDTFTLTTSGAISGAGFGIIKTGTGKLIYNAANSYTGATNVSAGTLELGVTNAIAVNATPANSLITLNGTTFSTGSGAGVTDAVGPLDLSGGGTSSITLGTGSHTLTFSDSSAQGWDGTLAITGWTGTLGVTGTAGKVFFGSSATLTSVQLDLITINGDKVMQLGTGEVVPISLCTQPVAQPTSIVFSGVTKTSITISFTAASPAPSKYLIVRSTESAVPTPLNETTYTANDLIRTGTVLQASSSTTYTDTGLSGGTTYYYFVYSYNDGCSGVTPYYRVTTPLQANTTTLAPQKWFMNDSTVDGKDMYTTAVGNDANNGMTPSTPKLTLAAIYAAASAGDWIYIDAGIYESAGNRDINFTKDGITFVGVSPADTVFRGAGTAGIYFGTLTGDNNNFQSLMITGYYKNDGNVNAFEINNCHGTVMDGNAVYGNIGTSGTGAVYIVNSSMIVKNVVHPCNRIAAAAYGGALNVNNSDVYIEDSSYSDNIKSQGGDGGAAISINGTSNLYINNTTFSNNIANHGGAISVNGTSNLYLDGCKFTSNEASDDLTNLKGGGALYIGTGTNNIVSIKNCSFTGNFATNSGGSLAEGVSVDGGAISAVSGTIIIDTSNFSLNATGDDGEDIFIDGATVYIKNSDFKTYAQDGRSFTYYNTGGEHDAAAQATSNYSAGDYNIYVASGTLHMYNSGTPSADGAGSDTTNPEVSGTTNTNYPINETTRTGTPEENWSDSAVGGTTNVQLQSSASTSISPTYTVSESTVVLRFDAMLYGTSDTTKNAVKVEYSINGGAYVVATGSPFQENGAALVAKSTTINGLTAGNTITFRFTSPLANGTSGIIIDNIRLTQTNTTQKDSDAVSTALDKYSGDCDLPSTTTFVNGFYCESANTWDLLSTSTTTANTGVKITSTNPASQRTISNASYNATTKLITFTTSSSIDTAPTFVTNDWVQLTGCSNQTWNRAYKITRVSSTTFTVDVSNLITESLQQGGGGELIIGSDVTFQTTTPATKGTVQEASTTTSNLYGWSLERRPNVDDYVLLNQDYNTSTYGNIDACRLKVANGKTLTVDNDDYFYPTTPNNRGSYVYVVNSIYNTHNTMEQGDTTAANSNPGFIVVKSKGNLIQVNHPLDYKDASVITPIIKLTKETPIKKKDAYSYISTPFTIDAAYNIFSAPSTGLTSKFNKFYFWDPTKATNIDRSYLGWQSLASQASVGVGFIARFPAEGAITYDMTGQTTNGTYTSSLYYFSGANDVFRNFTLMGNPYPGAISWADLYSNNSTNILGTVWMWASKIKAGRGNNGAGGNATTLVEYYDEDFIAMNLSGCTDCLSASDSFKVNGTGSNYGYGKGYQDQTLANYENITAGVNLIDGYIPSGSAFFVRPKATGSSDGTATRLNFSNTNRTKDLPANKFFWRTKTKNRYWINITQNDYKTKEQLIAYIDESSKDFDEAYDGPVNSLSKLQFFSYIENEKYSIQSRGSFKDEDAVKIGYNKSNGVIGEVMHITLSNREGIFADGTKVIVHDKDLDIYHDLTYKPYEFVDNGNNENRFEIVYRYNNKNNENENVADSNKIDNIATSIDNGVFTIKADENIDHVTLYDITGKLVFEQSVERKSNIYNTNLYLSTGVYVAKITLSNSNSYTQKIIVK